MPCNNSWPDGSDLIDIGEKRLAESRQRRKKIHAMQRHAGANTCIVRIPTRYPK